MKNINEKAVHLVEGSVWQNKHGKTYTVLFVSNVTVNQKLVDRFIPSVTFINAEGAVFTLDCDSFLRAYQWVEDNDLMMNCIEQVYKCNAGELNETVDDTDKFIDELEQEVGTEEPEEAEEAETAEQPVQEHQGPTLAEQLVKPFIVDFVTEGQPVLSKQELAQAFEGYSSYMDSRGVMFHKLMFSVRELISRSRFTGMLFSRALLRPVRLPAASMSDRPLRRVKPRKVSSLLVMYPSKSFRLVLSGNAGVMTEALLNFRSP